MAPLRPHRTPSRPIEAVMLSAVALAVLAAPLLQSWGGQRVSSWSVALTACWAASLAGLAWIRLAAGRRATVIAQLAVALSTPALGAAIAHGNGLSPWEIFVFLAPLPLCCAVFVRQKVLITLAGALSTVLTAVAIAWAAQMAFPHALRGMFFVLLTAGMGVNASVVFRRLQATRAALVEERQAALKREADEANARAELERRSIESERLAMVGRLAAGVAHEVNNPLAFVRANLSYVREELAGMSGPPDRDRQEWLSALDEAHLGVQRIQRIVSDLKGVSRDEGEGETVCVHDAAAEAIRLASINLPRGVELVAPRRDGPLEIEMARGRLVQILVNLIINAADAIAPRGRGTIRVDASALDEAGVRIGVEDDGPGIPPEVLPRLFQPFFTTKPVGKGTGLGLWLSREYVERRGGTLRASNRPEGGARFTLELAPGQAAQRLSLTPRP